MNKDAALIGSGGMNTICGTRGGTVIRDKVEYAIPFDLITHRLFVRPDIERIFAFREQKMRKLLPAPAG
jgi:hypothetical protein